MDVYSHPYSCNRYCHSHCVLHVAAFRSAIYVDYSAYAPDVFREFLALRQHPETDLARFHEIVDTWWGSAFFRSFCFLIRLDYGWHSCPGNHSFIVYFGLRNARPLSKQFGHLKRAAEPSLWGSLVPRLNA